MRAMPALTVIGLMLYVSTLPVAVTAAPAPAGPVAAPAAAGGVVLNEFVPSEPVWPVDDFVELRNTGEHVVQVGGWELVACLSPTTSQVATWFPDGAEIPPGGHVLLAHPDYAEADGALPDYYYEVEVPKDGGWLLYDPWTGYTDGVGLGSGLACTEGDPAPQCDWAAGEAVTRDEQGTDTDNNSADFTCQPRTSGF